MREAGLCIEGFGGARLQEGGSFWTDCSSRGGVSGTSGQTAHMSRCGVSGPLIWRETCCLFCV